MTPFYRFSYNLVTFIMKSFFRLRVEGRENFPKTGPFMIVANHVSYLDPPLVGILPDRQVFFMAKSELFKAPVVAPIIKGLGAFPVVRESADMKAIRYSISLLKEGKIVGIFPEGTRSETGDVQEGELGIALLVKQAKVPLVPCHLNGTYHPVHFKGIIPVFNRVTVTVGRPMTFDESIEGSTGKEKMKNFTAMVMNQLKQLGENQITTR
jgi:1-acyl-sn-glycerol-3-phosphate acyltransferase